MWRACSIRTRDKYFTRKKEEQRNLRDKALKYFENAWVWEKEKELWQLQELEETATDLDVKRALHYMIRVTVVKEFLQA